MADWQAFAESFLNRTAEGIRERTADAKSYEERQRELARTTGRAEFKKRTGLAQGMAGLGSKAKSLGATDAMVAAAMGSGPTGLVDLTRNLSELKTSLGARWTPEAAQNNFEVPEAYEVMKYEPDWMTKRINNIVGLTDPKVGDYKARDYGMLGNLLGFNARENARVNLDSELGVGGYSLLDLNELSAQSEYDTLTQGAYVNFTPLKYFDIEESSSESRSLRATIEDSFEINEDWEILDKQIDRVTRIFKDAPSLYTDINGVKHSGADATEAFDSDIANLRAQQRLIEKTIATQIVSNRASAFTGGGYLEAMKPFLEPYGVDIDALNEEIYNFAALDEDDVSDDGKTPPASSAVNAERNNVVVVEQGENSQTFEGDVFEGLSEGNRVTFELDEDGKPKTATVTLDGEPYKIKGPDDVMELYELGTSIEADAVEAREASLTMPDPFEEEVDPTLRGSRRKSTGVVINPIAALFENTPESAAGRNKARTGPLSKDEVQQQEAVADEAAQEVVKASKPLENFVQDYGRDVVTYLVDNGYAMDDGDEELREGLAMWFNENAAKSPLLLNEDVNGLIFLMKQALQRVQPDLSDNPEV
jgi:hypothetical protein